MRRVFFAIAAGLIAAHAQAADIDVITASTYGAIVGKCYDTRGAIDPDGDGPLPGVTAPVESCFMALDADAYEGLIVNTYQNVPTEYGKTDITTRPLFFWVDGTRIEIDENNRFVLDGAGDIVRIQDAAHEQELKAR